MNFSANWIWRENVVVAVIRPALGLIAAPSPGVWVANLNGAAVNRVKLGNPRLVWLKMLKASARNWTVNASEIFGTRVFLRSAKSVFQRSGPNPVLRPR